MLERRQVARREPVVVEVRGRDWEAKPLPWMKAGDLGNEILRQNTEATNEFVRLYTTEDNIPQLELRLKQKISDWWSVLKIAYPEMTPEEANELDIDECAALSLAALEVNHLEHIRHLVDPNFQTPTNPGGTNSSEASGTMLGEKIASTLDSYPSDSQETPSSNSLEEK